MALKILVIAGPNRGATYFLEEGESTLGRAPENNIVLASSQVSKRHIIFRVSEGGRKAEMTDPGSSNGTFVNGVLTRKKQLESHDKISIGPFVMEVLMPRPLAIRSMGTKTGIRWAPNAAPAEAAALPPGGMPSAPMPMDEPKSIFGKLRKRFDDVVLPVFYDFYEKHDFPTLLTVTFVVFTVLNLGFTVYPVLETSREEVMRQAEHQAQFIAKQIAQYNRQFVLEGKESSVSVDLADGETNLVEALVVNMEGRIMAPATRLNEMYNNPIFLRYKTLLLKNQIYWHGKRQRRETENGGEIVALEPVMVLSKTKGISVPGAVSVVVYSTNSVALDPGTISTIYFEALVASLMVGVVFMYLLYNMMFQPLRKLTDDMDRVLKGDGESVEKKYKSEIVDRLIDTVNSALSRIPKASGTSANVSATDQEQLILSNMMSFVEALSAKSAHPVLLLDPELRIKFASPSFEELSGIRGAAGEVIDNVSRDESFPSLIKELIEKSRDAGNDGVREDYDFNSGTHHINATALCGVPGKAEGFLFVFEKAGG